MATNAAAVTGDTLITIKLAIEGSNRKFQLPLKDLNDPVFSEKLRSILQIPTDQTLILERYSDSSASHVLLDPKNPSAYKQLFRAAKAKLRLRVRATIVDEVDDVTSSSTEPHLQTKVAPLIDAEVEVKPIPIVRPIDLNSQAARDAFFAHLASIAKRREAERPKEEVPAPVATTAWQVYCNNCDKPMKDTHYHCSICDDGDYDLCEECVSTGKVCPGEAHWLIKRCVKDGKVVNSTTQMLSRKQSEVVTKKQAIALTKTVTEIQSVAGKTEEMPGAFHVESKSETLAPQSKRTCNNCVAVLPEKDLVTCNECEDFDLCMPCHVQNKHGHHPAHSFKPICEATTLTAQAKSLCSSGRNVRHAAICDGCDKSIFGVRHKCIDCPDWDFCSACMKSARLTHRGHRFTPIYEVLNFSPVHKTRHFGIYCDGPLCSKNEATYITGVRYKCSICDDTDFCANCEAHPSNTHNQTHPMIKFKTSVRNVSITTLGENQDGQALPQMGDRKAARAINPVCAARVVRHSAVAVSPPPYTPQAEVQKLVAATSSQALEAHFVRDTITDGSQFPPVVNFIQSWTLRNPGPQSWPVGCTVGFTGGDIMCVSHGPAARRTNVTDRAVLPGESYNFSVALVSPAAEGKRISYWRLKSPDGVVFGHKLWCDINVKSPHSDALFVYHECLVQLQRENALRLQTARGMIDNQMTPQWASNHPQAVSAPQAQEADMLSNDTLDPNGGIRARLRELKLEQLAEFNKVRNNRTMQIDSILNTTPAIVPTTSCAAPAVENSIAAEKKKVANESASDLEGSQMIFPTLEKESPASSMHLASSPAGIVAAEEKTTKAVETVEFEDFTSNDHEDLDSLESGESEDDGFLTDEEYDILDASDEEFPKA